MLQELFRFSVAGRTFHIYGFGLMMVLGFIAAAFLARYLANRRGLDGELFINAALLGLFAGILGARLSHILENWSEFFRPGLSLSASLRSMLDLSSGGLTFYGGFLLAFPTLVLYALWKKVPVRAGMDIVAPCLLLAMGIGRIGCFLNGCCYGAACDLPWAVRFPYYSSAYVDQFVTRQITPPDALLDQNHGRRILLSRAQVEQRHLEPLAAQQHSLPLHPAQLYSAFTLFLLAAICLLHLPLPHAPGRTFALMLLLEGPARFTLELVRSEPAVWRNMSLSMLLGIALAALGALLWIIFGRLDRSPRAAAQPSIAPGTL